MKDEELKFEEIKSSRKVGGEGEVPRGEGSVERVSGMFHGTEPELYVQLYSELQVY